MRTVAGSLGGPARPVRRVSGMSRNSSSAASSREPRSRGGASRARWRSPACGSRWTAVSSSVIAGHDHALVGSSGSGSATRRARLRTVIANAGGRSRLPHQRRHAVAGDPVDDDELDVAFGGGEDALPRVPRPVATDHGEVGEGARHESPDRSTPAALEQHAGIGGDHLHDVAVGDREAEVTRRDPRHLHLPEQVSRSRRTPVRAEADSHAACPDIVDECRLRVQHDVRQRRPDDPASRPPASTSPNRLARRRSSGCR